MIFSAIYKISDYVSCIYVRTYMQYIDILAFLEYHIPSSMSLKRKRFRITHKRVISFLWPYEWKTDDVEYNR